MSSKIKKYRRSEYLILASKLDQMEVVKQQLLIKIERHGLDSLTEKEKSLMPRDPNSLFEPSWRKQPTVVAKVKKAAELAAKNRIRNEQKATLA